MSFAKFRTASLPYMPLILHVVPTLIIGFGFVLPSSPIAGINQYTVGFALAVLGFIPSYLAGIQLAKPSETKKAGKKPLFIARQSAHASGLLGRIVAFVMARETFATNMAAIDALNVTPTDRVLDIGCGHGRGVSYLARSGASVLGIDPSSTMVQVAKNRNKKAICLGQVSIQQGEIETFDFGVQVFDKAICVHVLCFWADTAKALEAIARVMVVGGTVMFVFHDGDNQALVERFPPEVYRFPKIDALINLLRQVGFDSQRVPVPNEVLPSINAPVQLLATRMIDGH